MFGQLAADEGEEGGGVRDEGCRLRDGGKGQRGVETADGLSLEREIQGGEGASEFGGRGPGDHGASFT